ncbi:MAG: hypothetical protein JO108_13690, partial [Acidobacteriaceae bacterium]|nr:hypothetical protein [Acidobacteriaceae bacterium]
MDEFPISDEDLPWDPDAGEQDESRPRDAKVDEAKEYLLTNIFARGTEEVFYGQQIEVLLEKAFFHWVTTRALKELVAENKIQLNRESFHAGNQITFYTAKGNRYSARRRAELKRLVLEYSDPNFTADLGQHGETMFDVALPRVGFLPVAFNTRKHQDREWTLTNHNLDRIFERHGIAYGVEIKNTLPYMPQQELRIKLNMCAHLNLKPLFIVRAAAKSYIHDVWRQGGYTLVFGYQLYPPGYRDLASRVRRELNLPVDTPRAIK